MKRLALTLSLMALAGCATPAPNAEGPTSKPGSSVSVPAPPASAQTPPTSAPAPAQPPTPTVQEVCVTPEGSSPIFANIFTGGGIPPFSVQPGWTVPVSAQQFTVELNFPKALDARTVKLTVDSPDWQFKEYGGDRFLNAYPFLVVPKGEVKPGLITVNVQEVKAQDGSILVDQPFSINFWAVEPGKELPACKTMPARVQK